MKRIAGLSYNRAGNALLTIECERAWADQIAEAMQDREIAVDIKEYRHKRSLDANAYAWVLMDKLSAKIGVPKEDLYRDAIRDIGGVSETVCVTDAACEKLCDGWKHNGIGWQTDVMPSKIPGCKNVILYYGSSTYDTEQMSRLIDLIIQDCKAVGIETLTPDQIAEMTARWGGKIIDKEQKHG